MAAPVAGVVGNAVVGGTVAGRMAPCGAFGITRGSTMRVGRGGTAFRGMTPVDARFDGAVFEPLLQLQALPELAPQPLVPQPPALPQPPEPQPPLRATATTGRGEGFIDTAPKPTTANRPK